MINNDFALENFITFCDDMIIANEGKEIDALKIYFSNDVKLIRKGIRSAGKLAKSNPDEAIKQYIEMIDAANDIKKRVKAIGPSDGGMIKKILSIINPVLLLIQSDQINCIVPTGFGYYVKSTTYNDEMSKESPTEIQREIQQAMNLLIHNCKIGIKAANDIKKKQK